MKVEEPLSAFGDSRIIPVGRRLRRGELTVTITRDGLKNKRMMHSLSSALLPGTVSLPRKVLAIPGVTMLSIDPDQLIVFKDVTGDWAFIEKEVHRIVQTLPKPRVQVPPRSKPGSAPSNKKSVPWTWEFLISAL